MKKDIYDLLDVEEDYVKDILSNLDNYYISYKIKKRSGKKREIDAPLPEIKALQEKILKRIFYKFKPHPVATGFIKKSSPVTNAAKHVKPLILVKIDVKNFFNSIRTYRIRKTVDFLFKTNLGKKLLPKDKCLEAINVITGLIIFKGRLPQGAPTSPAISNLFCLGLDKQLKKLEPQYRCVITRYADDIIISSKNNNHLAAIIKPVLKELRKVKLVPNKKKVTVIRRCKRMVVTGVVINEKINVEKTKRRNLRAELHNLIKNDVALTENEYQKLRGRIEWVNTLNSQYGGAFLKTLGKIKLLK